jgi:hypothetical protein
MIAQCKDSVGATLGKGDPTLAAPALFNTTFPFFASRLAELDRASPDC